MNKLVQIDFPFAGPFGSEMAEQLSGLAESINDEPGVIWKIWTENEHAKQAGGIYLFESEQTANDYIEKHTERLKGFGISEVNAKIFDVNQALSKINQGPL